MYIQLTIREKRCLDDFLNSVGETRISPKLSYLYSYGISIIGLILFSFAVITTLNNLNGRIIYWVLFPGTLGGVGLIFLGIFLFKYLDRIEEKKKMATIIKKLLNQT
jgi:hypothetical protein